MSCSILVRGMLHLLHCTLMVSTIGLFYYLMTFESNLHINLDSYVVFKYVAIPLLYLQQFMILPYCIFNFLGLLLFNIVSEDVKVEGPFDLVPFICFRMVTRGNYPELVRKTVQQNLAACLQVGLKRFVINVVTEKKLDLSKENFVSETVVPTNYNTKNGTLFKARNLQYCLDYDVHHLKDDDWIVHIDEETLMTQDTIKGVLNFVLDGRNQFGQGIITMTKPIHNIWVTLLNSLALIDDYGKTRSQFKVWRKPIFGWKGAFMVCKVDAEKDVSFDNGEESSLLEDCFFALKAMSKGYSFGFVEGKVQEPPQPSFKDIYKQKKRYKIGMWLTALSTTLPLRTKFIFCATAYWYLTLPLSLLSSLLTGIFFTPSFAALKLVQSFITGMFLYPFLLGTIKIFVSNGLPIFKMLLLPLTLVVSLVASIFIEIMSSIVAVFCLYKRDVIQWEDVSKSNDN